MQLTTPQRAILLAIENDPALTSHFEVLSTALEASLDAVAFDPERTDPYGGTAIVRSATPDSVEVVEVAEAAVVIGIAWLEAMAQATEVEGGSLSGASIDRDGIPAFVDTRPLFEVAQACGYSEGQTRLAFRKTRAGGRAAPRRAMKILAGLGALRPPKRKETLRGKTRIVPLKSNFACNLDACEIARAKAGSIVYALVARKDGYEAVRMRKMKVRLVTDTAGAPMDVISESDTDVMDGFDVPLVPCDELHETALAHFIQFLDQTRIGKGDKTYSCSYQRLVYRVATV